MEEGKTNKGECSKGSKGGNDAEKVRRRRKKKRKGKGTAFS